MLKLLFSGWLALLPLFFWNARFEGPKVLWFLIGGVGMILYWLFEIIFRGKHIKLTGQDLFYFLWLGSLFISSVFGVHFNSSILGGSYRHQGVVFFFLLWLVGKTFSSLKSKDKKALIKIVAVGVLVESAIVIWQVLFGKMYFGKPLGTIGEANAVAGFLAIGSYFVYRAYPKYLLLSPAISLFLAQSRAGILSGMVMSGCLIHLSKPKFKIALWSVVALVVSVALMFLTTQKTSSPFENRFTLWKLGATKISQKPLIGYGAESGEIVYDEAFSDYGIPLYNLMVDRAHNLFLDVGIWSGAIGMTLFIIWIIERFKSLPGYSQKYGFVAFIVYSFFQPVSIVHWILFFLIA